MLGACLPRLQIEHLVDVLLQLAEAVKDDPNADVRQHTAQASAKLQALAAKAAATAAQDDGDELIDAGQPRQDAAALQQHAVASLAGV